MCERTRLARPGVSLRVYLAMLLLTSAATLRGGVLVDGQEWRQLTETTGLTWNQVAAVCPQDGTACAGSAGGVDLTGWVWANQTDVIRLIESVTENNWPYTLAWDSNVSPKFFQLFDPTFTTNPEVRQALGLVWRDDQFPGYYIYVSDYLTATATTPIGTRPSFDRSATLPTNPAQPWDILGVWLYRDPPVAEICDNGIDDDGDGLIDDADPDCQVEPPPPPPRVGIKVRCIHKPIYPQPGEQVTIIAVATDQNGDPQMVDNLEIYVGDSDNPVSSVADQVSVVHLFTPNGDTFSYGCRAERDAAPFPETATSWLISDPRLRTVDVGAVEFPALGAVPVILNGGMHDKIDIVFFPDDTEYSSYEDPAFISDVFDLIFEGYFTIPWFVEFQWAFNFWIATNNTGNAGPEPNPDDPSSPFCLRETPDNFDFTYLWSDAAGIVHRSSCRDNAGSPGTFTIEMQSTRLQVVAHETGHRPFGLADEYCCDGGYFSSRKPLLGGEYKPRFPNLYKTENKCQNDAPNRPFSAADCRSITSTANGKTWWIGEPDYRAIEPISANRQRDLMQQTGAAAIPGPDPARYQVGDSEKDRLSWLISKCLGGEC